MLTAMNRETVLPRSGPLAPGFTTGHELPCPADLLGGCSGFAVHELDVGLIFWEMLSFGSYSEFALELSKAVCFVVVFCFVLFGVCCFIISVTVVRNFISLCVCVPRLSFIGGGGRGSFFVVVVFPCYSYSPFLYIFLLTLRLMPCTVAFLNELFLHLVLFVSMEML